jgi:outer membrane immunogenic protein
LALSAVLALAVPAIAADVGNGTSASSTVTGYSWAGTFFGLNAGYEWGRTTSIGAHPAGGVGGAQVGYNWQTGAFVFGGETDLQFSAAGDTFAPWQFSNPWFGSVRGRAGFAMNNVMFYATAGLSYGGLRAQLAAASETKNLGGWAAGAGVEVGLSGNWSARAEYLFMDLSDRGYVLTGNNVGLETGLMRFGVNYRF